MEALLKRSFGPSGNLSGVTVHMRGGGGLEIELTKVNEGGKNGDEDGDCRLSMRNGKKGVNVFFFF
jgi:hypothetical protein